MRRWEVGRMRRKSVGEETSGREVRGRADVRGCSSIGNVGKAMWDAEPRVALRGRV